MKKIAVIGANGLVGRRILALLSKCNVDIIALGRQPRLLEVDGRVYPVLDIAKFDLSTVDGAMMTVGAEDARVYQKKIKGWLIDNSTAFYEDLQVPMVVAELYQGKRASLVTSPNCVAIPIALVLDIVSKVAGIKQVFGSSYQSVSGAGKKALEDYQNQKGSYDIVMPAIGAVNNGISEEEAYITTCLHQILNQNIPISIMAVRVPVSVGHGVHLRVECEGPINKEELLEKFNNCPYIQYEQYRIPTNLDAVGSTKVWIGRVHVNSNILDMWVVSDNLLRGAAWNMCEIAKKLFDLKEKEGEYEKTK